MARECCLCLGNEEWVSDTDLEKYYLVLFNHLGNTLLDSCRPVGNR